MSAESDSETTSGSSSLFDEDTVLVAPPTKRRRCVTPLRKGCRNGGSLEYMENARRDNLQSGPKNREELYDWPDFLFRRCFQGSDAAHNRMKRVESLYQYGCILHTDFSGRLVVETIHKMLARSWEKHGLQLPDSWLSSYRCCENKNALSNYYLKAKVVEMSTQSHKQLLPEHHFECVTKRLPPHYANQIAQMRPSISKKRKLLCSMPQAVAHFIKMKDFIEENGDAMFTATASSPTCSFHPGKSCRLRYGSEDHPQGKRPISHLVGGSLCTPHTEFSKKSKFADPDPETETFLLFVEEAACGLHDLCTLENSSCWNIEETFVSRVEEKKRCRVVWARFGSETGGWPASRFRGYATAIKEETLLWIGPQTPQAVQADFEQWFRAAAMVSGSIFAGADTKKNISNKRKELAHLNGIFDPKNMHDTLALLKKTEVKNMKAFMKIYKSGTRTCPLSNTMMVEYTQPPDACSQRCGPWIPTLATASKVLSMSGDSSQPDMHIMTDRELDASQGWPTIVPPGCEDLYSDCMPLQFADMSPNCARHSRGSSMHLYAMAAWVMYVSGNVIRRDRLLENIPPVLNVQFEPCAVEENIDRGSDTSPYQVE